ncbi:hypothetical protein AJ80_02573 [Polytolypa hystricis UAMH7299]|uniref:Uncharacterized protein n=1 Tax=Polytolypa hystricis (strain UAMH7299) TaxID=1447883 RepID=A0A2B7YQI3_POLH7|nr:hypothetical protein AJ80_02573 [Polytolypa hystricis UAMH7299]
MSSKSTSSTRLKLPGFRRPLNWVSDSKDGFFFPTALHEKDINSGRSKGRLTPLREYTMMKIMDIVTNKPSWESKIFDEKIMSKWKEEIQANRPELRYKAAIFKTTGAISVYNGDVVKSDTAVSESIRQALKAAVASLENVPDDQKDYHPGSSGQVLDLVHPSLFPLVYGRSRIVSDRSLNVEEGVTKCGLGDVIPVPPEHEIELVGANRHSRFENHIRRPYSQTFQWLPCDVSFSAPVSKDGEPVQSQWSHNDCRITSYINNLHPRKHADLYRAIEQIIARAVTLWNMTLSPLVFREHEWLRIGYSGPERTEPPKEGGPEKGPGESDRDFMNREMEWIRANRKLILPEPGSFCPPSLPPGTEYDPEHHTPMKFLKFIDVRNYSKERGLQVIVKLANIHLTPEKPRYLGGTWHVEGQLNEHICATALYYYNSENITDSYLSFRQTCKDTASSMYYEQEDHDWLREIYGRTNLDPIVQDIGGVECKQGRLLTFPNIFQHRVEPFGLKDTTKPGHRKILALFLVDPNIRVISMANIPTQREDWWEEQIPWDDVLGRLPPEMQLEVLSYPKYFPISMDEAKEFRLELMKERMGFKNEQGRAFQYEQFSLCEH